ncbi:wall-associated receptor kinase 5-like [Lycium ferocissimum]|uniref:wall-associated receptor kinase 5-like n=1 Tax=Lycium ferocissimum TaxID=112874 RepID=UPI00281580DE|nr:wall-associated receptor kinase 5-like [Lycium ferocissimum]
MTLAYLHSFASMPIIPRDVKSANILLNSVYTVKSFFGASRLIPLDQTHLATSVLGTSGYLDLEYFRTSQLIEKSDIYRFGVVLAELLIGLKPIVRARNEQDKNLADYFILSMNNNSLFNIIDRCVLRQGSVEQLQKMAELVKNCLQLHGEDRPTMKEVAIELEGLKKLTGISWSNHQHGQEENDQDELSDLYTFPINSYGNTPNCIGLLSCILNTVQVDPKSRPLIKALDFFFFLTIIIALDLPLNILSLCVLPY